MASTARAPQRRGGAAVRCPAGSYRRSTRDVTAPVRPPGENRSGVRPYLRVKEQTLPDLRPPAPGPGIDRRECLGLLGLAAGALASGCAGDDRGPVRPEPVRVESRLLDALDREAVHVGVSIAYTDVHLASVSTGADADGWFAFESIRGGTVRVSADGYETRVATPIDVIGPELFLVPRRDPVLYERVRQVFRGYGDGMVRLPSRHLSAGERRRTMSVLFEPTLPESYRDEVLDILGRSGEFSAGGLDLGALAIREGPVIDSPEDGLFKFRLSDSATLDAVTLVKVNTHVLSGSSTTFRPGLGGSRLRDVAGREVLTSWGAIGASPNGGLMDPDARPEDARDVPMVTIAYRLEAGYLWA